MTPRMIGYVRVSTDEQAAHGASIPAQTEVLQAFSVVKGCKEGFRIYTDDGYSGKNLHRPAIKEVLEQCRQGSVSALVVWRLDRLSRSLRDTLSIVEDVLTPNGVTLISATESIDTSTSPLM